MTNVHIIPIVTFVIAGWAILVLVGVAVLIALAAASGLGTAAVVFGAVLLISLGVGFGFAKSGIWIISIPFFLTAAAMFLILMNAAFRASWTIERPRMS